MHKFSQLSVKVKVVVLSVYAVILVALVALIINMFQPSLDAAYQDYGTTPYDDNLILTIRTRERRNAPSQTSTTAKESSTWDLYMYLTKKDPNSIIVNVHGFITAITADGNFIYKDKQVEKLSTFTTVASLTGFSSTTNVYDSSKEIYTKTDNKPVKLYIHIYYEMRNLTTEKYEKKQFTYQVSSLDIEEIDFNSFTERGIVTEVTSKKGYVVNQGELFELLMERQITNETTDNVRTRIYPKTVEGVSIDNMVIEMYVKADNHVSDTENFFSDYIQLATYYGSFNSNSSISTLYTTINKEYHISKIYVIAYIKGTNNETVTTKFWVNYNSLLTY